jgi:hypothetical protein
VKTLRQWMVNHPLTASVIAGSIAGLAVTVIGVLIIYA